jgi:putative ABC transport system permease protein
LSCANTTILSKSFYQVYYATIFVSTSLYINCSLWPTVNTSMAITLFISCIGLFGLTLFTVEKRSKEISIRKILGAGATNIAFMVSKDFVILIIIALFIASPVAWYFMNEWLETFAYRINISGWVFLLAGISAVTIALITIAYQAVKASLANPVKSLRIE